MHEDLQSGIEVAHRTSKNTDKHVGSVAGCEELVGLSQDTRNFDLKDDSEEPFYDNDDDDNTFPQPSAVETMHRQ